jgi:hypothetical protein
MSDYGIGKTAKMLQAKLADHLAGPFREFLPQQWIAETLEQIGHRFRLVAFSPLGDGVGVHRSSVGPGPFV